MPPRCCVLGCHFQLQGFINCIDDDGLFGNSLEWLHLLHRRMQNPADKTFERSESKAAFFNARKRSVHVTRSFLEKPMRSEERSPRCCEAAENEVKLERKLGVNPF